MTTIYLNYELLVDKHDEIIEKSGGKLGIMNEDLLMSCLGHMQNDVYYPEFEDKLTYLVYSLVKNHGFYDGNKRTSIAAGAYFLEINSYNQFIVQSFIRMMERVVLLVATNKIKRSELRKIIEDLVENGELSEESQFYYARQLDIPEYDIHLANAL